MAQQYKCNISTMNSKPYLVLMSKLYKYLCWGKPKKASCFLYFMLFQNDFILPFKYCMWLVFFNSCMVLYKIMRWERTYLHTYFYSYFLKKKHYFTMTLILNWYVIWKFFHILTWSVKWYVIKHLIVVIYDVKCKAENDTFDLSTWRLIDKFITDDKVHEYFFFNDVYLWLLFDFKVTAVIKRM